VLALREYDRQKLCGYMSTIKEERLQGSVATTEDDWTDGKGNAHFNSTSLHVIAKFIEKHVADVHSQEPVRAGRIAAAATGKRAPRAHGGHCRNRRGHGQRRARY